MPDEFYIGYAPVPPGVARATRRAVTGLAALALSGCATLIVSQQPFPRATFEYGTVRAFEGVIETAPYPALLLPRPGGGGEFSRYLLAGEGKHGAAVGGMEGRRVHLRGSLIYRDGHTMIEVESGSVQPEPLPDGCDSAAPMAGSAPPNRDREGAVLTSNHVPATLEGEIVDSKCYLGAMNPGRTKVHRDCAARCIRGGIPPMLVTGDGSYILAAADVADFVGESVQVEGDNSVT